jgi:hypothetical protein
MHAWMRFIDCMECQQHFCEYGYVTLLIFYSIVCSKLGMLIRMLTKVAIIVNAAAYVWSWSPVNM